MKRKINESSDQETLKEIERTYGKKVREALVKYCEKKGLDITQTVYDTKTDGNGQTPWDKFDNWAETKLGLDVMGGFDDTDIDDILGLKAGKKEDDFDDDFEPRTKTKRRAKRDHGLREVPLGDMSDFDEASGSHMDEFAIAERIGEELKDCEWVNNFNWGDDSDMTFDVDGFGYRVTVTKEFAPREFASRKVNAIDDLI